MTPAARRGRGLWHRPPSVVGRWKPLRGGGAPAVDGSIDGIQQASGHIEGVPAATYNLPLSPKLPVASNDSGPLPELYAPKVPASGDMSHDIGII